MTAPLLEIKNLRTDFFTRHGQVSVLKGIDLTIERGQIVGLVGETGAGKSMTGYSIMRMVRSPGKIVEGEVVLNGRDLVMLSDQEMHNIRGAELAMIFQDPRAALNPLFTIEQLMAQVLNHRRKMPKGEIRKATLNLLREVQLSDPESRLNVYAHQLSGGQCQRVMIALALACQPDLLIADEPTTGLDVTIQQQIVHLMRQLRDDFGTSQILITHDLGMASELCDAIAVMYAGNIVEFAPTEELFSNPKHPYTLKLMSLRPRFGQRKPIQTKSIKRGGQSILEVNHLKKSFPIRTGLWQKKRLKAVDNVSFSIEEGQTIALVGESGSGKTTLGLSILRLIEPTSGEILFEGKDFAAATLAETRSLRQNFQIVFQNPLDSLNPRLTVGDAVAEPLRLHQLAENEEDLNQQLQTLFEQVNLSAEHINRYPHQLSGGQRQRVAIARALATNPKLIVLDEPTSALDVSVQARLLDLLRELQAKHGLTYIFISHDLAVVSHLANTVAVMYLGQIIEYGPVEHIFKNPRHPYTMALLSSIPGEDVLPQEEKIVLEGEIPSPLTPPSGCRFHTRCPFVRPSCKDVNQHLNPIASTGHFVACDQIESKHLPRPTIS
ncbi:MAG: ABC transporter ATP-binding protein, partial [Chloroflexota bacterium]